MEDTRIIDLFWERNEDAIVALNAIDGSIINLSDG